jgi:dolichol-phosphate mannosyltransferase
MNRTVVIIPTYNERENIAELVESIINLRAGLDCLIIDDNSPDGTGRIADGLSAQHSEVSVMHRSGKAGLGKAYAAGFSYAIKKGYDSVITMDADFSHDPRYLPQFIEKLRESDVVIGTRYIKGGGVKNWPLPRILISRGGSLYSRLVTGMPLHDATGGFNAYHKKVLEAIQPATIKSEGYSFQIEMKYRSWKKGFRLVEIPIVFVDRTQGKSKMSKKIFLEAIFMVWKLRLGKVK